MIHYLKTLPEYFAEVARGTKTFEVRKNDRPFNVDDELVLREVNCGRYTGRIIRLTITYILKNPDYCKEGYCIIGFKQPAKRCRMIPLEPDCRGYTDVFVCTSCHQFAHLGFIRKEYSGNYCIECGSEVEDGDVEPFLNTRRKNNDKCQN